MSNKIILKVQKSLENKEEIIAAYIFGSYLYSKDFEDIDIGILHKKSFNPHYLYEIKLEKALEEVLNQIIGVSQRIHIVILNNQDLRFLYGILLSSRLIYCRDNKKRANFESQVLTHYLDIKPIYDYYDYMRKLRYAD